MTGNKFEFINHQRGFFLQTKKGGITPLFFYLKDRSKSHLNSELKAILLTQISGVR